VSAQDHHASAAADPHGADEHPEAQEETLAHDEAPTPLWLPVLGAGLFFIAFILIAAF
jgi:hypothetical protein